MSTAFTAIVPLQVGGRPGCARLCAVQRTLTVCAIQQNEKTVVSRLINVAKHTAATLMLVIATSGNGTLETLHSEWVSPALAEGSKGIFSDVRPQLKVSGGSASTTGGEKSTRRSVTKTVTRGITLENADFSNGDFEGVSFQQSILRQANFSNSNLRNASFFDADLTGANFANTDLSNTNVSHKFCFWNPVETRTIDQAVRLTS